MPDIGVGWGPLYPKFTNLGVIALAYSCIAPLVLGFATVGFTLIYLGFRYNCLFTFATQVPTRGRCYARALQQLVTGLYLAEVCLIGLYALGISQSRVSIGPLVCMIAFLVVTIVWQLLLSRYMSRVERTFPDEQIAGQAMGDVDSAELGEAHRDEHIGSNKNGASIDADGFDGLLYTPGHKQMPQETRPDNTGIICCIKQFFRPKRAAEKHAWDVAPHLGTPVRRYTNREHLNAYRHPAATSETPIVWIARDEYGISKKEIYDSKQCIGEGFEMTDEGSWVNDKGKVEWNQNDLKQVPVWEDEPIY
jgi:calcium permeable stress-gated cation channel